MPRLAQVLAPLFLSLWACDSATRPDQVPVPVRDVNPLPNSKDVYLKKGEYAFGGWASWSCSTLVYREPLDRDSPGPDGWWRVRDSNDVHCIFEHVVEVGKPPRDTLYIETRYLDTLAFRETEDSLFATNYHRFGVVFLPAELLPQNLPFQSQFPDGFLGYSHNASGILAAFPKRDFPPMNPPKECPYTGAETTTACKLLGGDLSNTYASETLVFLDGIGLYSLSSRNNTGNTHQTSTHIRLLRRTTPNGDTEIFDADP